MSEYPFEKLVNWAMRYAVKNQILDFKNANINKSCELCGSYANITADHLIKFKNLKENILLENQEYPKEFDKDELGSIIFRKEDIVFEKLWQEYHKKMLLYEFCVKIVMRNLMTILLQNIIAEVNIEIKR